MRQPQTQEQDELYDFYDKNLYRITGTETSDSILDMLGSSNSVDNSPAVAVSGSDITSGVDTSTTVTATGSMQAGKKMFDNTASGYILGVDPKDGLSKLYIGNTTSYFNWDGTNVTMTGNLTIGTTNSIMGGQTAYNTGTGFFLGYSGGAYKLSIGIGGSSTNSLTWDGSTLTVNGYAQTTSLRFGGTGADGALSVSSGTTTIDLGGASVFTKNYTSISITGTGKVVFSNPAAGGTIVIFKSTLGWTITTSSNPAIDLTGIGGTGGGGGTGGTANSNCSSGAGGASTTTAGSSGVNAGAGDGATGLSAGTGYGAWIMGTAQTGGGAAIASGSAAGGIPNGFQSSYAQYLKLFLTPGSGGGGGRGGNTANGGAGGRGGGAFYGECAGAYNVTATINAGGLVGGDGINNPGVAHGGGGGGGGGGSIQIFYNSLTADSGTYTVSGAVGGSGPAAGGNGADGYKLVTRNTEFT